MPMALGHALISFNDKVKSKDKSCVELFNNISTLPSFPAPLNVFIPFYKCQWMKEEMARRV